jgi:hypothetical protein
VILDSLKRATSMRTDVQLYECECDAAAADAERRASERRSPL